MKQILEVDSVILDFASKRVLQDVYLKCDTGNITGLLGRNGAGKSCLMKIIFGDLASRDNSVRLNGKAILNETRRPEDIRYLPQGQFIPRHLTVKRIIKDFELYFEDFVNEFPGFKLLYHARFGNLSGGEQRIVEIYTILASKTKFCMLDEPFSQVMPLHVESIKRLIIREKGNKGIIVTDHLYQHIVDICDSLYVINNGKTYLTKSIQDLATLGYIKEQMVFE